MGSNIDKYQYSRVAKRSLKLDKAFQYCLEIGLYHRPLLDEVRIFFLVDYCWAQRSAGMLPVAIA
jgi:hypothetical protein